RFLVGGPPVVLDLFATRDDGRILDPPDEVEHLLKNQALGSTVDVANRLAVTRQKLDFRYTRLHTQLSKRCLTHPLSLLHAALRKLPVFTFGHRRGDDQVKDLAVHLPKGDDAARFFSEHVEPPLP